MILILICIIWFFARFGNCDKKLIDNKFGENLVFSLQQSYESQLNQKKLSFYLSILNISFCSSFSVCYVMRYWQRGCYSVSKDAFLITDSTSSVGCSSMRDLLRYVLLIDISSISSNILQTFFVLFYLLFFI